jgi:hypothetical protein
MGLILKSSASAAIKSKIKMEKNIKHLKIFLFRIVVPVIRMLIREALDQTVQAVMSPPASNKLIPQHLITTGQNFLLSVNINLSAAIVVTRILPDIK